MDCTRRRRKVGLSLELTIKMRIFTLLDSHEQNMLQSTQSRWRTADGSIKQIRVAEVEATKIEAA